MTAGRDERGWGGHPLGISTLFFTEMWERFSYYGMRAFLILYMTTEVAKGGLGFDVGHAGSVYGTYTGSIWLATIGGGIVADRLLGAYRSVMWGGIIIALGHFTLAFRQVPFFYAGLALIVMGTGLLKPNATTMLGTLYSPEDERRDAGFSIFYMGINLGAFIGPIIAGWLAQKVDWHAGFACAGFGMLFGVIQYVLGKDRLRPAWAGAPGGPPARTIGFAPQERGPESVGAAARVEPSAGAGGAASSGGAFTRAEWMRMLAVCVFFVFAALFWGAYEQAASTLALFADQKVDRVVFGWSIPSSWFVSIQALFVIVLSPIAAWVWLRLGRREPSTPMKFSYGLLLVGASFVLLLPAGIVATSAGAPLVSPLWLVAAYFIQVAGELCLSPVGNSVVTKLAPARVVGMMMGVWFLSIAAGNKLAGYAASLTATIALPQIFGAIAGITIVASIILMLLTPSVRRMMGGVR
jgi:proton-dependent oligopeptide transporter, POT family